MFVIKKKEEKARVNHDLIFLVYPCTCNHSKMVWIVLASLRSPVYPTLLRKRREYWRSVTVALYCGSTSSRGKVIMFCFFWWVIYVFPFFLHPHPYTPGATLRPTTLLNTYTYSYWSIMCTILYLLWLVSLVQLPWFYGVRRVSIGGVWNIYDFFVKSWMQRPPDYMRMMLDFGRNIQKKK